MLSIFKTTPSGLERLEDFEPGAWIDLVSPTDEELSRVAETFEHPSPLPARPTRRRREVPHRRRGRSHPRDRRHPGDGAHRRRAGLRHHPAGHAAAPRLLHHHLPAAEPHPGRVRAGGRAGLLHVQEDPLPPPDPAAGIQLLPALPRSHRPRDRQDRARTARLDEERGIVRPTHALQSAGLLQHVAPLERGRSPQARAHTGDQACTKKTRNCSRT